jgi:predicted short-subunit dehydrogenase-like oxidoreductase (DUF2520 family)
LKSVSIIGAGRLGASLGHALARKGFNIKGLSCRRLSSARESAKLIGRGQATVRPARAATGADILFLCVPDDSLEETAALLAASALDWRGRTVFHSSGLLPARILAPLRKKGAFTASFHPIQTFARKEARPDLFKGIGYGLEGDAEALMTAGKIVRRLGGRALFLAEADKPLYHAACVFCSGGTAALLGSAFALLESRGLGEKEAMMVLLPLALRTLQNVKEIGAGPAVTGPFVRGDIRTVLGHLRALPAKGTWRTLYAALGRRMLETGEKRGLTPKTIRTLRKILKDR